MWKWTSKFSTNNFFFLHFTLVFHSSYLENSLFFVSSLDFFTPMTGKAVICWILILFFFLCEFFVCTNDAVLLLLSRWHLTIEQPNAHRFCVLISKVRINRKIAITNRFIVHQCTRTAQMKTKYIIQCVLRKIKVKVSEKWNRELVTWALSTLKVKVQRNKRKNWNFRVKNRNQDSMATMLAAFIFLNTNFFRCFPCLLRFDMYCEYISEMWTKAQNTLTKISFFFVAFHFIFRRTSHIQLTHSKASFFFCVLRTFAMSLKLLIKKNRNGKMTRVS